MKRYVNLYDHPTLAAALTVDDSRARRLRYSGGVCVAVELSDDGKTVLSAEVVEHFTPHGQPEDVTQP
jgi:hypothetical protein